MKRGETVVWYFFPWGKNGNTEWKRGKNGKEKEDRQTCIRKEKKQVLGRRSAQKVNNDGSKQKRKERNTWRMNFVDQIYIEITFVVSVL